MRDFFITLKNILTKDIRWKIFSVVIAVFIWFIVMNTINPVEIQSYSAQVSLTGVEALKEKGYVITNEADVTATRINVKISGTRPALDELSKANNKSKIVASIDMSNFEPDPTAEYPTTIQLGVSPVIASSIYVYSYDIESYTPAYVNVDLDKVLTVNKALTVNKTGTEASGYIAGTPSCDVESVTVKGPSHIVSKLSYVSASVSIDGATSAIGNNVPVIAYDENGNKLEGLEIGPSNVSVTVPILKKGYMKVETPVTTGEFSSQNIKLVSVTCQPDSIPVTGDPQSVEEAPSIRIPPIALENIISSKSFTYDATKDIQAAGLTLNGESALITVNVDINVENAKDLEITSDDIRIQNLANGLEAEFKQDSVFVSIGGYTDDISVDELSPTVDLKEYTEEGTYSVPVELDIPRGEAIKAPVNIDVFITGKISEISSEEETETTTEQSEEAETEIIHEEIVEPAENEQDEKNEVIQEYTIPLE